MIDLQLLVDQILPEESEAPKAPFDCEPNLKSRDGTMRHDWGAFMRKQFAQDELNIQWKERQRIRTELLALLQTQNQ
jgi:hypothetical protein